MMQGRGRAEAARVLGQCYQAAFLVTDIITQLALYEKGFGRRTLHTHRFFGRARGIISGLIFLEQYLKPP